MATITQTIETIINGEKFSIDNNYTASHISTIDGDFTLASAGSNYDIPIYIESDADGDIKFIAFSSTVALDKFELLDESNAEVIDLLDIIPDSTIVAGKEYQIPGSAGMPTVSNTNDVKKLRVSSNTVTADDTVAHIELIAAFDSGLSDTIV